MRVAFFHQTGSWSGQVRAFDVAARGLAARRDEVTFVCPPESAVEQRLSSAGHEVVPLPVTGAWLPEAVRLRRVLRDRFVEVVFVHEEREQLVAAAAQRFNARGAVVRRVPAGGTPTHGGAARSASRLAATAYLFSSEEDRLDAAPRAALAREPVVAELGVDVTRYDGVRAVPRGSIGAAGATRLIVCVADASARARVATVLRAVALLAPRHPELRLALLGPGSDHEDVRMHAAALGITKVVSHLGEREDHLSVLRAADIGWVVAEHDNAAFAFLDLMALRVPVLAERGRLAQYYVADGIAGTLLPPGDAPITAAAVASFLAHDERRVAMGNAGRVRVARDFAEQAMIDGFARAGEVARARAQHLGAA